MPKHPADSHRHDERPEPEPLTPEEKEAFLARARAQGRSLTSDEQYAIFGPPAEPPAATVQYENVKPMEPAQLTTGDLDELQSDFFPELGGALPANPLVTGVIIDFDHTLAAPCRALDSVLEEGAKAAELYMRSTGMELPPDFYTNIIEARRFAEKKSEDEREEHIADDAMSFLLQFFGYPASRMDPEVLRRAVDIFYAPEMTSWQLNPGTRTALEALHRAGYRLALLANYSCDRVFQRIVDYLDVRTYFDIVLASASVEYRKPDEAFFNLVLNRWDALPHEVVIVGDSLNHDIQGGLELGALTVLVDLDTTAQVRHDNSALAKEITPDAIIVDLTQLPALVNDWSR